MEMFAQVWRMGEANEVCIGTWAKVEMKKLSKFSVSGINNKHPGLAFIYLKKKQRSSHLSRNHSSDVNL